MLHKVRVARMLRVFAWGCIWGAVTAVSYGGQALDPTRPSFEKWGEHAAVITECVDNASSPARFSVQNSDRFL